MESSLGKYEIIIMVLQSPPLPPSQVTPRSANPAFCVGLCIKPLNDVQVYHVMYMYPYKGDHRYATALKCGY